MNVPRAGDLFTRSDMEARDALLASRGLQPVLDADHVFGCWDEDILVATGSLKGNILQGLAVRREAEGLGLAAVIVSALLAEAMRRGHTHVFLFTSPGEALPFIALGFRQIAGTGHTALLEWGRPNLADWLAGVAPFAAGGAGCIVMNANPFTLGHRHLVEQAAKAGPTLVLVVEEDISLFPFAARHVLVTEGVAGIPGVSVLPGGPYTISRATFPGYFLKDVPLQDAHADVDLELFRRSIAPALGIVRRFVGTEPLCGTTSVYNAAMKAHLPPAGIEVIEIPRLEAGGLVISASLVREAIRNGKMADVKPWVPPSTWAYLASPEAEAVLRRIQTTSSRH